MFCTNCGKEMNENLNFCSNCGNTIANNTNIGSIVFERTSQFYGVLVPIKVFLDGNLVATLKAGEKTTIKTTIGNHRLSFNLWSGNGEYDINIFEEHPNIKVLFKLSMGLVTSKPKIVSVENID